MAITATLTKSCTAGDTLVAFVTVGQQVGDAGVVAVAPQGWLRLYEHAPSDHVAEFHAWFVLSACSGVSAATFTVSAPGNPDGTTGSVVLTEYSGLPSSPVLEFGTNTGNGGGATSGSLTSDDTAPSGTFVLTALSLYAPSSVTSTPSGWTSGGSEGGSLPATTWWQVGAGQVPSAAFSWSPASAAWEMSMVIIGAGTASPPNVVQEASGGFSSSSWSVALPDGVTTGDAVVAIILSNATEAGQGFEASTVSGGGVTWQKVTGFGTSGGGTAEIWAGFSSAGTTGSTTVTAKLQGSASGQMVISEVSGIDGVDTTSTASGSSTTPTASSISPTSGDFLVAGMASPGSVVTVHPTPQWSTYSVSTSAAYAGEWWSNVPSHSISAQWDDASSAPWAAVVAAFIDGPGAPTVNGVAPNTGPTMGGTSVTVSGTNLTGATVVDFGSVPASNIVVNNGGTSLVATAPTESAGTVDVTVTTLGGTSATNASDHFTYQAQESASGGGSTGGASTGYWMVGSDGSVFSFGAPFEGSLPKLGIRVSNIVSLVPTSDGNGYWLVGNDGGVFAFGDAGFVGSLPGMGVRVKDIVGVVPTADGKGYWMVGSDGGVFAFGDAGFVGSLPGLGVHVKNIVAVVPTVDGKGYWMVGSDGGVFAFGDAGFVGSLPGMGVRVKDIVGVVPTADGKGYWMVGSDGGVFAFGDAGFVGSLPGLNVQVKDIVGVVPTADGKGYWMVGSDGGVFAFGDAGFVGSLPGMGIHVTNIVGFARG